MPQPDGETCTQNTAGAPEWMAALAIVILFATPGFGGFFLWPFFVGAVLIVCLVYWYCRHSREVQ
ncbi:hypothetical protein [Methanoregula formicica]|uniref:Uncharacterized protein n=1 Tax=Methanoregula formicica (strain DSM 22288 / NBRC 105244 / SMSP) TaxID=593750 RepID=L0HC76_METFS|nr:hypothetical protein [Methanoregula formicica]AGB01630.1 hypothetical protein Metfor_0567 [Methanoregula formicica SMSP]